MLGLALNFEGSLTVHKKLFFLPTLKSCMLIKVKRILLSWRFAYTVYKYSIGNKGAIY
jgi:hypothetical protein